MATIPEQWVDQARYDFDTARAMFDNRRFLYVLFCCQQAVEKMLKGVIAKRTGEFPPRLHNLMRLAEHTGLEFEEARLSFFGELSSYYIQTRYPKETDTLLNNVSQEIAQEILTETEDTIRWLSSMI